MNKKSYRFDLMALIAIAVFFLGIVFWKVPLHYPYILNFDEAVALVLAYVTKQGYRLYEQVWHDHLSGLSLLLNGWLSVTGFTLYSARIMVLSLSTIMLGIFYLILRVNCGILASCLSVFILSTCPVYINLSTTMLRELPSLFFTILSIFIIFKALQFTGKLKYGLYLLSAIAFVFSLQIKLSGITIIPTVALIIFLNQQNSFIKRIIDIVIWLVAVVLVFVLGSLTIFPFSYANIIKSHVSVAASFGEENLTLLTLLQSTLKYEPIYLIVTVIAIIAMVFTRNIIPILPPLVWLGSNLFRFATVAPIWTHYYVHLIIPAVWIIALFVEQLKITDSLGEFQQNRKITRVLILKMLIFLSLSGQFLFNTLRIITNRDPGINAYVQANKRYKPLLAEAVFEKFKNSDKLLLTDNPHYIYQYFLKTPPETAVITRKRFINQNLDGDFILEVIEKRQPDLVFLYRFEKEFLQSSKLKDYLEKNYIQFPDQQEKGTLFISPKTWQEYKSKAN
ncbi:MAG: glucose-6-phosphate dehydrogenase [Microcystis aeruginosa Ma_QC_Ca_00000000_S207]|uniref:Glucose-6-phosphate dehydrogenase n=1 Tax=Microcystis aeruginosa Ma_QC_Ca_00000000_S207 TaxID=2486251 RepID=A0A552FXL4_MICAE|nr:MAG: glucose-6-phosphate dehydrogenase [Microcystis aeruginosa Ma_QC_Ca_00000000_S207]